MKLLELSHYIYFHKIGKISTLQTVMQLPSNQI